MALKALKAGKHVFVEKPLAINEKDLIAIEKFFYSKINNKPILFTGYNRRFSVITESIIEAISLRDNPLTMNYIMNTEYMS